MTNPEQFAAVMARLTPEQAQAILPRLEIVPYQQDAIAWAIWSHELRN